MVIQPYKKKQFFYQKKMGICVFFILLPDSNSTCLKNNNTFFFIALAIFALLFQSCEKPKLDKDISYVIAEEIVANTETEIKLKARIIKMGNINVVSKGFVWGMNTTPTLNDYSISIPHTSDYVPEYQNQIMTHVLKDKTLYARAFITLANGQTVYSNQFELISNFQAVPQIESFSPQEGTASTELHIYGGLFVSSPEYNKVWLNDTEATVIAASYDELVVRVPEMNTPNASEELKIKIEVGGKTAYSEGFFTYISNN